MDRSRGVREWGSKVKVGHLIKQAAISKWDL